MSEAYKSNMDQVIKDLKNRGANIPKLLKQGIVDGLRDFEGRIIVRQLTGRKGDMGLNTRSGHAKAWWTIRNHGAGDAWRATLGSRAWYLKTHQYGATIRPKEKRNLATPIHPSTYNRWPKDFPKGELQFIKRKNGPALLVRDLKTKGGKIKGMQIMYVLKPSVKIPKRLTILEDYKENGTRILLTAMKRKLLKVHKLGTINL